MTAPIVFVIAGLVLTHGPLAGAGVDAWWQEAVKDPGGAQRLVLVLL